MARRGGADGRPELCAVRRRDNNVTLILNWNTVPSTGLLMLHHAYSTVHTFQVPEAYS